MTLFKVSRDGWMSLAWPSVWPSALLLGIALLGNTGCSSRPSVERAVCDCRVIIDGRPAPDVRIVLVPKAAGHAGQIEGVTNHQGIASMHPIPGAALTLSDGVELRAAIQSLGDWHVAKPWSDVERSPLVITWSSGAATIDIEVPKKAVRAL